MEKIDPAFLDKTIQVWQPRSEKVLTRENARQMIENLSGFFQVLYEWDQKLSHPKPTEGKQS